MGQEKKPAKETGRWSSTGRGRRIDRKVVSARASLFSRWHPGIGHVGRSADI
jgi:hypothetical protein